MTAHSKFSASAAHRWMECPGSMPLSRDLANTSSPHAREGTAAHEVAERLLTGRPPPDVVEVDRHTIDVTETMLAEVRKYTSLVESMVAARNGTLFVESKVNYSAPLMLADDQGWGTADAIIVAEPELIVVDLKYGMGQVVEAENNVQMALYAIGALAMLGDNADITTVRMVIAQPRLNAFPEWVTTTQELTSIAERAWRAVMAVDEAESDFDPTQDEWVRKHLKLGDKQCRWCRAASICPARINEIAMTFDVVPKQETDIGTLMGMVDRAEAWCKAVRAEVESRLLAGKPVSGWKLVQGKRGARAWADTDKASVVLGAALGEAAWRKELLSPPQAEKLLSKDDWESLAKLVTQSEGKPSVAPADDKRPQLTITPVEDEFTEIKS